MSLHKRQSQGAQFSHFPVLDGVRGIAVLMVVVTHFGSLSPANYHYFHPGLWVLTFFLY
jgi:peptidoglycan/LPS O-acetylase OafA/YrhL